jgi:hypothetical protein
MMRTLFRVSKGRAIILFEDVKSKSPSRYDDGKAVFVVAYTTIIGKSKNVASLN